jgi:signal transduction histidine kinase
MYIPTASQDQGILDKTESFDEKCADFFQRINVTNESGRKSFVRTQFEIEGFPMVLITVEDSGIGIPDEAKSALFQPFRQAQRSAGGTGLGLFSLTKR